MNNRIVRSSTRLATFNQNEKSEWYQDKILYVEEVVKNLPTKVYKDGVPYVKRAWGYIREDLKEDKDVLRGLYPLAIPSNFIFKIQYPELCHIYQFRNANTHAAPELKLAVEMMRATLEKDYPVLAENLPILKMQPKNK